MNIGPLLRIGTLVLAAAFSASTSCGEPLAASKRVTLNFQNVDLTLLAEAVTKFTGIPIEVDAGVAKRVSLISERPRTASECYRDFNLVVTQAGLHGDGVAKHVVIATPTPRPRSEYNCHACTQLPERTVDFRG